MDKYKSSAFLIGFLIAIMVTFNGTLSNGIGTINATFLIHFIGLVTLIIFLKVTNRKILFSKKIPLIFYTGGFFGVVITILNNINFAALGVSLTLALGLLGQSITSLIIDHYGILDMNVQKFNKKKIYGFIIIFFGIIIMVVY
jgi:transporter family-2 protein